MFYNEIKKNSYINLFVRWYSSFSLLPFITHLHFPWLTALSFYPILLQLGILGENCGWSVQCIWKTPEWENLFYPSHFSFNRQGRHEIHLRNLSRVHVVSSLSLFPTSFLPRYSGHKTEKYIVKTKSFLSNWSCCGTVYKLCKTSCRCQTKPGWSQPKTSRKAFQGSFPLSFFPCFFFL